MIKCKLCLCTVEGSKTDPGMCQLCFTSLAAYKRLVVKDRDKLPPRNLYTIEKVEAMCRHNQEHGLYVPQCYGAEVELFTCISCNKSFNRICNSSVCEPCKADERAFRALYRNNPGSPTLHHYMSKYDRRHDHGLKVPKLYLDIIKEKTSVHTIV